ncbi:MAG: helix-turn-helix domain-containing protein [Ginsengibacter sp.]
MKKIPVRHITSPYDRDDGSRFKIRDVKDLLDGKDLVQELHRHDFFFVLALEKGSGTHEIDFTQYQVSDNSIFILRPGQVHRLELKSGSTGFLVEFDTSFYHPEGIITYQRLIRAGNKNFCEFEAGSLKKLLGVLSCMFNEFVSRQEGYIEVIKASLDIFFIEFIRQSKNPHSILETGNPYTQERLEDFLQQLEIHIINLKQVSQYADLLNLSTYQLNAITKASVGKSASELISDQIILEAKRYLLATPSQVKDIAAHLGYEDISYFIRFFRKHTGYSPEAFRKNFQ